MAADDSHVPLFADLNDADPDVIAAGLEAKRTLPLFLEAVSSRRFWPASYLVKVPFLDRSGSGQPGLVLTRDTATESSGRPICHLWLRVTAVLDDLVFCYVVEVPEALHLETGTSFVISTESIEDWMIHYGGDTFGGFSLRVIRSRLQAGEQSKFDTHTGIRSFKELTP